MNVRTGAAVGLALCLGVALARPQIGRFNASQESTASARQEPASSADQEAADSANQEAPVVTEEMSAAATATTAAGCNAELWNHVYHKTRLHVVHSCIAVTGTITHIKRESDGDRHIQLAVDPEFSKLLNSRNKTAQGNTLIVEAICEGQTTQAAAETTCEGFHSPVAVPKAGTKVRVIGSYVLDKAQGWMEIHPVSIIDVLR